MPPWSSWISKTRSIRQILLLAVSLLSSVAVVAQISPGPLSRAHAHLEGTTNCTQCHKPGSNATLKCLDCHTEIANRIASGRGYHASVVQKSSGSQTCATCHSEHNGAAFALVRWQPSLQQFDHSKTGWKLDGKHASVDCAKCHNATRIAISERLSIRAKDLNRTFLGISTQCVSCHADEHHGQLGLNCQQCHSTSDWKKTTNFDHSKTRFALTGAHGKVECEKCHHLSETDQKPKWSGLAYGTCDSCHRDPHRGTFSATCQTCHTTSAWKSVPASVLNIKFDHGATKFPLLGKHASVECSRCHTAGDFKKPIAFSQCSNCHRPDPHSGQFAKRADGGECSSCHTVEGWKPSKFQVADHVNTSYPLVGKHAAVECAKCHIPAGKATLFKIKFSACTDCHRDKHAGQFQNPPLLNRCDSCHTVKGFSPSTFTLARHKETRFPLGGAHVAVACGECHRKNMNADLREAVAYRWKDLTCAGCHQDPHRGQFAVRMAKAGPDNKPLGCLACHMISSWKDLSKFDHSSTKFELLGTHRSVACVDCHKPPNLEVRMLHVDFSAAPHNCEGCHTDPHAAQFVENGKVTQCASCHNTNKWKPSLFDHNIRTLFKLEGVHANVRCARCHANLKQVEGKDVLFYKPTPRECSACHGAEMLKSAASK